ncbi:hypothetical protein [Neobacillus niacini]|uniref:hypothetical protein n=1 Tax=Neobacillus niacini TaxID=86668 RepID=UPI002FFFFF46
MIKDEMMLHHHTDIQELIRFIDQKAGALLVIYGFIFTATIEFAKDLKFIDPFALKTGWDTIQSILLFALGFFLLATLIYQVYFVLFEVIKPRHAKKYTQEEVSVVYFEHTAKRSKEDFVTHYDTISEVEIRKEFLCQIYEISCILSQKSKKFNSILKYLFTTIIVLLIFIYLSKSV